MSSTVITPHATLIRVDTFMTAEMDDDLVMMSLESNAYFGLDNIGKVIWESLAQPKSVADLCKSLTERYNVEPAQCQADVIAFLTELHNEGLVRLA